MNSNMVDAVVGVVGISVFMVLWAIPVILGVRSAKSKGLSPHWMWFGVHPITGWIAFLVIRYRVKSRLCQACGKGVPPSASFCPHCQAPWESSRRFRWFQNQVSCATCRNWIKLNDAFCPACSTPTPRILCPLCESNATTLVGGRSALLASIMAAALAGSFFTQADQSLSRSQVFNYTKSLTEALTGEILIFLVGGVLFVVLAAVSLFGAWGTMLKRVSCQKCGATSPLPAEPSLAATVNEQR